MVSSVIFHFTDVALLQVLTENTTAHNDVITTVSSSLGSPYLAAANVGLGKKIPWRMAN
jgi:hypothetical protein